jgi:hypothetical protein
MITFRQAAHLQKALTEDAVEDFFCGTLEEAFMPTEEGKPAYFALATSPAPDGHASTRIHAINQWFIDARGFAPQALIVHPSLKAAVDRSLARKLGYIEEQAARVELTFVAYKGSGVPAGSSISGWDKDALVPGVPILEHHAVPKNLVGHVFVAEQGEVGIQFPRPHYGGITALAPVTPLFDENI